MESHAIALSPPTSPRVLLRVFSTKSYSEHRRSATIIERNATQDSPFVASMPPPSER